MQAQIRLLLMEQSDHALHCLPFHLYSLDALLHRKTELCQFYDNYGNYLWGPTFMLLPCMNGGRAYRVYPLCVCVVCVCVCVCVFVCVPEAYLTHNFVLHCGISKKYGTNDHPDKTLCC